MDSTKGTLKKKKSLVKLTLIFLVTFSSFTTPSPKFFVFSIPHNFIVSLSKQYKILLIWSFLQVSILFWYIRKNLVKYVCSSPFNLLLSDYCSDQAKDSKSWGKHFYPLQLQGLLLNSVQNLTEPFCNLVKTPAHGNTKVKLDASEGDTFPPWFLY